MLIIIIVVNVGTHVRDTNKIDGLTLLTFSDASGGGVSVRSLIMSTSET